jgi:hypothetical protein
MTVSVLVVAAQLWKTINDAGLHLAYKQLQAVAF